MVVVFDQFSLLATRSAIAILCTKSTNKMQFINVPCNPQRCATMVFHVSSFSLHFSFSCQGFFSHLARDQKHVTHIYRVNNYWLWRMRTHSHLKRKNVKQNTEEKKKKQKTNKNSIDSVQLAANTNSTLCLDKFIYY